MQESVAGGERRYGSRTDDVRHTTLRGPALLQDPLLNKGTAFTHEERAQFGLVGLLPDAVSTLEQQARRAYANVMRKEDVLERYLALAALQDRNEHLFQRVLVDHLEELLPIVYTPTVGRACQEYSRIFSRARGAWITPAQRGRIASVLGNAAVDEVRLVVVTDNERVLGLGDQGAGGMGIPIGKLAVYTAAAGIHPAHTLPVSLDVGTDNAALLEDELYLGWRHPRLRGPEYDALVEEFVRAVRARFPGALLQWEDFKKANAFRLLARYRQTVPSFNDDIQGTAAVALAGLMAASRLADIPLAEQRVVILGAGAAGIGIAQIMRAGLRRAGLSGEALVRAVAVLDSGGLLVDDGPAGDESKRPFVWPEEMARACGLRPGRRDLLSVVEATAPTALLGTAAQPGAFTQEIVRAMAKSTGRPAIFPLSNPTSRSEATPDDILHWTEGRALVATGSAFAPVHTGHRTVRVGQANSAFIFPGVGLGVLVARAREVTDTMFVAAADALASSLDAEDRAEECLYPRLRDLRRVTRRVAEAVVRQARADGVGDPIPDALVPDLVGGAIWEPRYPELESE